MTEPAFDELLRRLVAADTQFVVVGGLAVGAWGVIRSTGEQVAIETDLGRLDVVQGLEGVPNYEELRARSSETEILGVTVAVCSLDDLKTMKRAAGRTRDLADLEDLEAAGD